jgi:hypothetical protein
VKLAANGYRSAPSPGRSDLGERERVNC